MEHLPAEMSLTIKAASNIYTAIHACMQSLEQVNTQHSSCYSAFFAHGRKWLMSHLTLWLYSSKPALFFGAPILQWRQSKVYKIRFSTLPEFPIVGSCKGLLCLGDSTTKSLHCVELPKSIDFNYQYVMFGFGFDTISNKYKVVKIVY